MGNTFEHKAGSVSLSLVVDWDEILKNVPVGDRGELKERLAKLLGKYVESSAILLARDLQEGDYAETLLGVLQQNITKAADVSWNMVREAKENKAKAGPINAYKQNPEYRFTRNRKNWR